MMELYLLEQLIAFSRQGTLSGAAENRISPSLL